MKKYLSFLLPVAIILLATISSEAYPPRVVLPDDNERLDLGRRGSNMNLTLGEIREQHIKYMNFNMIGNISSLRIH